MTKVERAINLVAKGLKFQLYYPKIHLSIPKLLSFKQMKWKEVLRDVNFLPSYSEILIQKLAWERLNQYVDYGFSLQIS
jgi:hypothetical protein